jgi:hypothetical protein
VTPVKLEIAEAAGSGRASAFFLKELLSSPPPGGALRRDIRSARSSIRAAAQAHAGARSIDPRLGPHEEPALARRRIRGQPRDDPIGGASPTGCEPVKRATSEAAPRGVLYRQCLDDVVLRRSGAPADTRKRRSSPTPIVGLPAEWITECTRDAPKWCCPLRL